MKLIHFLPNAILFSFLAFLIFACNDNSTETNNSVESINVSIKNDTLSLDLNVENMTSNAVRNSPTHFSKDTVNISIMVEKLSSGKGSFYIINGQIVPDTSFKGYMDSVTSTPKIYKARVNPASNSFSLVLSVFTGKASVLVTSKK